MTSLLALSKFVFTVHVGAENMKSDVLPPGPDREVSIFDWI
jgi:hypothetical protein